MNIVFAIALILSIISGAVFRSYKDKKNKFTYYNTWVMVLSIITLLLTGGHFIAVILKFFC